MRQHDLSQTEVSCFQQHLLNGIMLRCEGRWFPSEPLRASGFRSIINDLTSDPLLIEAAAAARIRDIRFRCPKAVMWVNPLSVRVKLDEERFTQVLFGGDLQPAASRLDLDQEDL